MRDRCRESSIPERRWRYVSGCRRVGVDAAWRKMSRERARGVARGFSRRSGGRCRRSLRNTKRETMECGACLGDLSSILNPGLFISPFTVDAKTASRKAQRNTSRYCIRGDGGALRGRGGLKQTARNLCIHLADLGREAANFYRLRVQGGFTSEDGAAGARPRCRQDCNRVRNTQLGGDGGVRGRLRVSEK